MKCLWQTVVIILNGNREFHGIRLVEVIWKAVLGMVNFWIGEAVDFHNTLHGFRSRGVMGTASLEVKLFHQLIAMREEVLYKVYLTPAKPIIP